MNTITTITATMSDGSSVVLFPVPTVTPAPVVTPEDVEIDVVLSDGTTKKFVPAPVVTA
jgi:hypothetical protein